MISMCSGPCRSAICFASLLRLRYWRNDVNGGACDLQRARDTAWVFFVTSPEFDANHPAGNVEQRRARIKILYRSVLGRDIVGSDLSNVLNVYLTHGWDDVVWNTIFSQEFTQVFWNGWNSYDGRIC